MAVGMRKKAIHVLGAGMLFFMIAQAYYSYYLYIDRNCDWAWRPSFYRDVPGFISNVSLIGKDRNPTLKNESTIIDNIDMFLVDGSYTGNASLIKEDAPQFRIYSAVTNNARPLLQARYQKYYDRIGHQRVFAFYDNNDIDIMLPELRSRYHSVGFNLIGCYEIHPLFLDGRSLYLLELTKARF